MVHRSVSNRKVRALKVRLVTRSLARKRTLLRLAQATRQSRPNHLSRKRPLQLRQVLQRELLSKAAPVVSQIRLFPRHDLKLRVFTQWSAFNKEPRFNCLAIVRVREEES